MNSPRWYLEGSAVFMETWMAGGLGRAQGAYDEMVFRAMVRDAAELEAAYGRDTMPRGFLGLNALVEHGRRLPVNLHSLFECDPPWRVEYSQGLKALLAAAREERAGGGAHPRPAQRKQVPLAQFLREEPSTEPSTKPPAIAPPIKPSSQR